MPGMTRGCSVPALSILPEFPMKPSLLAFSLALALTACGGAQDSAPAPTAATPAPAAPAKADATAIAAQLETLYTEFWEESLKLNPVQATFVGDPRYNDQLPNFLAADYRKQTHNFNQKWLDRVSAIDGNALDGQARL